jgi:hypothetical protein
VLPPHAYQRPFNNQHTLPLRHFHFLFLDLTFDGTVVLILLPFTDITFFLLVHCYTFFSFSSWLFICITFHGNYLFFLLVHGYLYLSCCWVVWIVIKNFTPVFFVYNYIFHLQWTLDISPPLGQAFWCPYKRGSL